MCRTNFSSKEAFWMSMYCFVILLTQQYLLLGTSMLKLVGYFNQCIAFTSKHHAFWSHDFILLFCRTTVFSHSQTVVVCPGCQTVLCQPTGGKARLTEGCSFRRKGDQNVIWKMMFVLSQVFHLSMQPSNFALCEMLGS